MPLTAGMFVFSLSSSSSESRTTSSLHSHRQPRRWRRARHQLPRLPVHHQPGREAAPARREVHGLQRSNGKLREEME